MVDDINIPFDIITVACGTGTTLAGLITALNPDQQAIGFAVLKGADFLDKDVTTMLINDGHSSAHNWHIEKNYHFGGYARTSAQLLTFIRQFKAEFGIGLDAVYSGKMFYGLFDLIINNKFAKGARIIAVHTGGLQGNAGYPELQSL
jgi:1-aminocyclopropane-1-carboxylate deaminase/D-cysteine desulfhydrase-like pyridoxal-dependent ACC family enzyme